MGVRTLKGKGNVVDFFRQGRKIRDIQLDTSTPFKAPRLANLDHFGTTKGIEAFFTFSTDIGFGQGIFRLAQEDGQWRIFTLYTALRELSGHEEPIRERRALGVQHGENPGRKNWLDGRIEASNFGNQEPDVLVIGLPHCKAPRCLLLEANTLTYRCWPGGSNNPRTFEDAKYSDIDHRYKRRGRR